MTSFICYWINCVLFNLGSLEAEWDFFVSPLTIHSLQVSTVATATFAFPPAKPSRETPGQKREGEGERGRGEAAWMISSLQQLHTAARQSRNFLSNFQVAVQRKTSGRPRSEPEPARFFLCVPPPRGQPTELLRSLCLGLGAPCYELKQKGERKEKQDCFVLCDNHYEKRWVALRSHARGCLHPTSVWGGQSTSSCRVKVQGESQCAVLLLLSELMGLAWWGYQGGCQNISAASPCMSRALFSAIHRWHRSSHILEDIRLSPPGKKIPRWRIPRCCHTRRLVRHQVIATSVLRDLFTACPGSASACID